MVPFLFMVDLTVLPQQALFYISRTDRLYHIDYLVLVLASFPYPYYV